MAATIQIISLHGATGSTETQVDGGTMRFKAADNDTADANNPLVISGSTIYSYIKQCRYKATVAPSNLVDNLKFYTDGSSGMGTGVDIGVKTYASGSYVNPATQGQSQVSGLTSVFTYTSGSALAVTGSQASTGLFGDIINFQMSVTSAATQGTTPSETFTFSFDES